MKPLKSDIVKISYYNQQYYILQNKQQLIKVGVTVNQYSRDFPSPSFDEIVNDDPQSLLSSKQ